MPDDTTTASGASATQGVSTVIVPPEVEASFPDIIALMMKSESMNDGERQYWIDILPVMTPDQIQQLRDILTNERDQLAAIEAKYAPDIKKSDETEAIIEQTEEERQRKRQELESKESAVRSEETQEAEDILKQMD